MPFLNFGYASPWIRGLRYLIAFAVTSNPSFDINEFGSFFSTLAIFDNGAGIIFHEYFLLFKKFKCLDYYNTWMYCKKNSYKTDIGIKIYKAEKVVHLNRELVINYDEDCSESTPVPLSFNDLGIRNDYSVSDWIVGNIATALLEE